MQVRYDYNAESDVLHLWFGQPVPTYSDAGPVAEIMLKRDVETDELVGLTILQFKSMFESGWLEELQNELEFVPLKLLEDIYEQLQTEELEGYETAGRQKLQASNPAQDNDYSSLNETVLKYQHQLKTGNKRLQNKCFEEVQQRLCHLINQIVSIVTDTPYEGNQAVYQIVLEKMQKLTSPANADKLRFTCSRIVESQGLSVQDVRQQVLLQLVELMTFYRPTGDFIAYATYLLPRRITQWLWKQQKSASQQFSTVNIDELEQIEQIGETACVPDSMLEEILSWQHSEFDEPVYLAIALAVSEVRKECGADSWTSRNQNLHRNGSSTPD